MTDSVIGHQGQSKLHWETVLMRIKSNALTFVNSAHFAAALVVAGGLLITHSVHATIDDSALSPDAVLKGAPPPPPPPPKKKFRKEPKIREFEALVLRRSSSARTYLMKDIAGTETQVGKVLLVTQEKTPVLALRVMKTYPDSKQFAAKRVKRYNDYHALDPDQKFLVLEKTGDDLVPVFSAQDEKDIIEIEQPAQAPAPIAAAPVSTAPATAEAPATASPPVLAPISDEAKRKVPAFDPELDAAASPEPKAQENQIEPIKDLEEEVDPEEFGLPQEEIQTLETHSSWLTASMGYYRNTSPSGTSPYFSGGGIRYAQSFKRGIFLKRATLQDSLALEGGIHFYKIINFVSKSDAYEVLPLSLNLRYNFTLPSGFATFLTAGFIQNVVTRSVLGTDDTNKALSSLVPSVGAGAFFQVGPQWYLRLDLGIDAAGLGLTLKF